MSDIDIPDDDEFDQLEAEHEAAVFQRFCIDREERGYPWRNTMSAHASIPAPKHLHRDLTLDDFILADLMARDIALHLEPHPERVQDRGILNRLINAFWCLF